MQQESLLNENLYELLNLEHKQFVASVDEVKKAYRKASLKYHPDKLGENITETDKQVWLKVQNAYETLSDPARRKKYDSTLPFDDVTPKINDFTEETFYKVFGDCFINNARFSTIKPVPTIGDKNTPLDEVKSFYSFWDNFKTWREFSQYAEYDTEEANDRYEKRWMEKQNKKQTEKYDKEERKRLIDLTNLAYSNDPRIKAVQKAEADAKEAIKKAKKDAKAQQYKLIEEAKKVEEEKKVQEAKDEAVKKAEAKEAKKLAGRKYRQTVKDLIAYCVEKMPGTNYDKYYIDELVKKYP